MATHHAAQLNRSPFQQTEGATCNSLSWPASDLRSEQVWEEWPAKVRLVEDEAHKANHGNAANSHLQLQDNTVAEFFPSQP